MTFSETQINFMKIALREAKRAFDKDEVPIGAVIIHNNKVIAKAFNQTEMLHDPTAHAEMIAITSAANYLNTKNLSDCDLYVTIEPCAMCAGAILLAKIRTVYFGSFETKFGAAGSIFNILGTKKYNHSPEVYSGLMEMESKYLLQEFFKSKRYIF